LFEELSEEEGTNWFEKPGKVKILTPSFCWSAIKRKEPLRERQRTTNAKERMETGKGWQEEKGPKRRPKLPLPDHRLLWETPKGERGEEKGEL